MPIYEYSCKKCLEEFEKLAKFEDKVRCPKCNKLAKRLISTGGFILKGEGFYRRNDDNS